MDAGRSSDLQAEPEHWIIIACLVSGRRRGCSCVASQFMTKQVQIGLLGYFFEQLTADIGCGTLCPFKSRTAGIGPQFGYLFPAGDLQGYLNLKAYCDYETKNHAHGYTVWLTLAFSPKAPSDPSRPSMVTKTPPRD
jgi:hypothetical protein